MNVLNVLNNCFIIFLAFAILFFVITIVLFFVFDIRTVFNIRTGRAQAKTVKEMQEANTNTGRLRVGKQTQSAKLSAGTATASVPRVAETVTTPTEQLSPSVPEQSYGADETQLLSQDAAETTILKEAIPANTYSDSAGHSVTAKVAIRFEIVKKIVHRDTDEVI